MKQICPLKNVVQPYAWGSRTAIAELLREPTPSSEPQAELWMGAHPKAPSDVLIDGEYRSLADEIAASPADTLGARVAGAFAGRLPFLFKVLAAAQPLSIQAHPTIAQAREGFARENERGVPIDAPDRNYRDDNHKPEIICALTPFWALNGFRPPDTIAATLGEMGLSVIAPHIAALGARPDEEGLKRFFTAIMTMDRDRQREVVAQAVLFAGKRAGQADVWDWALSLNEQYPGDIGVLSPFLLNLLRLEPGEAMLLHAGRLHAYLDGVGIELMANSDNVLRGGLTPKHVDVPELLQVLTFEETRIKLLRPDNTGAYPSDVREFRLSVLEPTPERAYESDASVDRDIQIVICTRGEATVTNVADGQRLPVAKGVSFVVPAAVEQYRIEGNATLYRASVPPGGSP
jgi:mannose-6-phosphate isomerase